MKIDTLRQAIARILDADGKRLLGTGFLVTGDGCMLTCWHVVESQEKILVQFQGEPPIPAELVAAQSTPESDIAVLRLKVPTTRAPAEVDGEWRPEDAVSTYGYQYQDLFSAPFPLRGTISGETVVQGKTLIALTGIDVQPGCSGAPVYNHRTEMVVGIIRATFDGKSTGFATPVIEATNGRPDLENAIANNGRAFVDQTVRLFRAMGYELDSQSQPGIDFPSFYSELSAGATRLRVLVGCLQGERDRNEIQRATMLIQGIMQARDLDRAFLVTSEEVAARHRDATGVSARVEVLSFGTLETRLIDFSGYLRSIERDYTNYNKYVSGDGEPIIEQFRLCDLHRYHIDVGCRESWTDDTIADDSATYPSARQEFYTFLSDDTQKQICFLGDYGTGKTTLCLQLTYELATKHLADPHTWSHIPLFIPLNALDVHAGVHRLILDTLTGYGVNVTSPDALKYMMQRGRFVLILDAFDEVADVLDRRSKMRLFETIRKLVGLHSKIVLTGRTQYFSNEAEALANFRVLELTKFDEAQIKALLSRHWPDSAAEKWHKMRQIHDLADLARTPILTSLIISTLDKLSTSESGHNIDSAELYDGYTKAWLDHEEGQTDLTPEERKDFMEELAWRMYHDNRLSVPRQELNEIISGIVSKTRRLDPKWLESPDMNVRACSFLARNRNGDYQFAHKSFMEFFVAKRLVHRLDAWAAGVDELWPRSVPYEISSFVGQLVADSPRTVAWVKELSVDRHNNGFLRGLCIDVQMMLDDTVKEEPMIFAMAVSTDGNQVAAACGDGHVRILAAADLAPVTEFIPHREWVRTLAYSDDGRYFASGGWDNRVVIRSMPDYAPHLELELPDRVNSICFSPDGTQIICGGYDRTLSVWDLRSGESVRSYAGHTDSVQSIVIDAESNAAISGSTDRTLRKWSLAEASDHGPQRSQGGPIRCLAISPDGRHMATGSWTGELILWSVDQLVRTWQSTSHQNMISDFGFAPDSARFVSCSDDGSIKVWSPDSNEPIGTLPGEDFIVSVCYSKDGRTLYSGGYDSVVRAWDTATWTLKKSAPFN